MRYKWVDYNKDYKNMVESWMDIGAVRFTGCDDGWDQFVEYWKNEQDTVLNENFFVKVILDGEVAVGVIAIFWEKDTCYIQELLVSPDRRKLGVGSSALAELLEDGECIIGKKIKNAQACIYPLHIVSRRAFERAGFCYSHAHPDGDVWYYEYQE